MWLCLFLALIGANQANVPFYMGQREYDFFLLAGHCNESSSTHEQKHKSFHECLLFHEQKRESFHEYRLFLNRRILFISWIFLPQMIWATKNSECETFVRKKTKHFSRMKELSSKKIVARNRELRACHRIPCCSRFF